MKISKFNSHQRFQLNNIKLFNSEESNISHYIMVEPSLQYLVRLLSLLVGMWGDHSAGIGGCAKQISAQKKNN